MSSAKFKFGSIQRNVLWEEGASPLDLARPNAHDLRSLREECCHNDDGKWKLEYEYVAHAVCHEGQWEFCPGASDCADRQPCAWPKIRDKGFGGKALDWFCKRPEALRAKLTRAEVAMLRLYTGPMYQPLNNTLRAICDTGGQEALRRWWTCITVLICGLFKLSFAVEGPARTFRGLGVKSLADCAEAGGKGQLNFEEDGGVELAFCSTTTDCEVAQAFSQKGDGGLVLCIELSSTTRAASVQWLSQYPEEAEWLLPPFTMLRRKECAIAEHVVAGREPSSGREPLRTASLEGAGGGGEQAQPRQLSFIATLRVPFRELNMRVAGLDSKPELAAGVVLESCLQASELGVALEREHLSAGLTALRRGFFGGMSRVSALLFCVFGMGALYLAVTVNSAVLGNDPKLVSDFRVAMWCMGVAISSVAVTCFYRAVVLLMLYGHDRREQRVRAGESVKAAARTSLSSSFTAGELALVDAHPNTSSQSQSEAWERWALRAVQSTPHLYMHMAITFMVLSLVYLAMTVSRATGGRGSDATEDRARIWWLCSLAFAPFSCVCGSISHDIRHGRKRQAQKTMLSTWIVVSICYVLGQVFWKQIFGTENTAQGAELALNYLVATCFICVLSVILCRRRKEDLDAVRQVTEDGLIYDGIFREMREQEGVALCKLNALAQEANSKPVCVLSPTQFSADGVDVKSGMFLSSLFAQATRCSSEFRHLMTKLAVQSGCRLEIPSGRKFEGIKGSGRTLEKVCRVYAGRCDLVLDLLRATIVGSDMSQLIRALELLCEPFDSRFEVCRIKNRFDDRARVLGGFRNTHVNLVLTLPSEARAFVCEVQLQHRRLWDAEQSSRESDGTMPHERYIAYRNRRAE
jgi:hypothetical protein